MRVHATIAFAFLFLAGCKNLAVMTTKTVDLAGEERAIRDAEAEWSKAAAAKDVDKIVSYFAEDGTYFPSNAPFAMGKAAVRTAWTGFMAMPGVSLTWSPIKVEVAKDADMAYSFGTYNMSMNDAQGKAMNDRGKYVTVWKKQADGSWKVMADIANTDLPMPAADPPR